jgi:ribosomal protein S26
MKMYCLESRSRGISYMKYVNGRRIGLVTFCIETAFYNGLLKEREKEDRSDRKTRKKM